MWNPFKKRQNGDLERLVTAYRFFLKAVSQAGELAFLEEGQKEARKWKGGFGKASQQLFRKWPTIDQSKRFEKLMVQQLKKTKNIDEAFIHAFNKFLNQKRLTSDELKKIRSQGH